MLISTLLPSLLSELHVNVPFVIRIVAVLQRRCYCFAVSFSYRCVEQCQQGQLTKTIIFTVHHFDAIFKSQNAPHWWCAGTELTSPSPRTLPHSWPFEPRTQHTHIGGFFEWKWRFDALCMTHCFKVNVPATEGLAADVHVACCACRFVLKN